MTSREPISTVVLDPPWRLGDNLPGPSRGAAKNYPVMTPEEIVLDAQLMLTRVGLADDCFLLLWRLSSMQGEALYVAQELGFVVKTEIVWRKRTKHGKRWFGMGRYTRAEHESCLICTRGRPKPLNRRTRSIFTASAGVHSQKPEAFYVLVENTFPGPHLELYARKSRPGWTQFGNQLGYLDAAGVR